jgi:hypothetical protein
MLNLLGPYKYVVDAIVIAALIAGACWLRHWDTTTQQEIGAARVQAAWDNEKTVNADARAKEVAANAAKTAALQATIDTQRSQANAQINALNSSLASAIAGLRERPARPNGSDLPQHPSSGEGCTGAGLYRPDAEFLTREAARAKQLQIRLDQCYGAIDAAREAISPKGK